MIVGYAVLGVVALDECVVSGAGSWWFGEWSWCSGISGVVGICCTVGTILWSIEGAGSMIISLFDAVVGAVVVASRGDSSVGAGGCGLAGIVSCLGYRITSGRRVF